MKISELLNEQNVFIGLKSETKEGAISALVDTMEDIFPSETVEAAKKAVLEREAIMSTGVGKGLAIPHGKCAGLEESYAAFALLDEPIDFGAIDNQPVTMMFLLVGSQSQNSVHIKMLSRISRLMNNSAFRDRLMDCSTPAEIVKAFKKEEDQFTKV